MSTAVIPAQTRGVKDVLATAPVESAEESLILLLVMSHTGKDGTGAWPSVQRLVDLSRLSRRTVQRSLDALVSRNVLSPGDPACIPDEVPGNRRPKVYDLAPASWWQPGGSQRCTTDTPEAGLACTEGTPPKSADANPQVSGMAEIQGRQSGTQSLSPRRGDGVDPPGRRESERGDVPASADASDGSGTNIKDITAAWCEALCRDKPVRATKRRLAIFRASVRTLAQDGYSMDELLDMAVHMGRQNITWSDLETHLPHYLRRHETEAAERVTMETSSCAIAEAPVGLAKDPVTEQAAPGPAELVCEDCHGTGETRCPIDRRHRAPCTCRGAGAHECAEMTQKLDAYEAEARRRAELRMAKEAAWDVVRRRLPYPTEGFPEVWSGAFDGTIPAPEAVSRCHTLRFCSEETRTIAEAVAGRMEREKINA